MQNTADFVLLLSVLLFSIVVHEVAHAWVARREGDYTADRLGRITLNPIPHLDPMGSFIVPLLLYFTGAPFLFGWAKPVPVDPGNFRDPVWSDIRVSLAGIVSNLILAGISLGLLVFFTRTPVEPGLVGSAVVAGRSMAQFGVLINLILAVFNLVPIPPLDGSRVVYHLLPAPFRRGYAQMGRYGMVILILLFIFAPGFINLIFAPVVFLMNGAYELVGL